MDAKSRRSDHLQKRRFSNGGAIQRRGTTVVWYPAGGSRQRVMVRWHNVDKEALMQTSGICLISGVDKCNK